MRGWIAVAVAMCAACSGSTGPAGPQGTQGPAGPMGTRGTAGPKGDMGAMGAMGAMGTMGNPGAGHNTLVVTSSEPAGANCATGGMKFQAGVDANDDGVLQASEINPAETQFVCNGASGPT